MPLVPPTVGQSNFSFLPPTTTATASTPVSILGQQHKVSAGSDGIARFFADLYSKFQHTVLVSSPFKNLDHAKARFAQTLHALSSANSQVAQQRVEGKLELTGNRQSESLKSLDQADLGPVYKYSQDRWMSYEDMNGVILGSLKEGPFFKDRWNTRVDVSINQMMDEYRDDVGSFDDFVMRVPPGDRNAFKDFARSYYGSMAAHQAVMAKEAVEKLPSRPCISDRGLRDFPGAVDGFKNMLSKPGKPSFLREPGFCSSTTSVQTPQDLRDRPTNKANFPNEISLLTIGRSGKDISLLARKSTENEVLFTAGCRFEVFGHKEVAGLEKTKNVFFQLQLSAQDFELFTAMEGLAGKLDHDPGYQLTGDDHDSIASAVRFNQEVQAQLEEFPKLGWKDDLAPGMPATCELFRKVIDSAAGR
jgi:hypothetical protein